MELQVEGKPLKMEINMGASMLLISEETFCQVLPHYQLQGPTTQLRTYPGQWIVVVGQLDVEVVY